MLKFHTFIIILSHTDGGGDQVNIIFCLTKILICQFGLITDPPGDPEITGYTEGEIITAGQFLTLTCVSYGGNPLGKIFMP